VIKPRRSKAIVDQTLLGPLPEIHVFVLEHFLTNLSTERPIQGPLFTAAVARVHDLLPVTSGMESYDFIVVGGKSDGSMRRSDILLPWNANA